MRFRLNCTSRRRKRGQDKSSLSDNDIIELQYINININIILQPYFTSRPVNSDQRACFCGSFCNFWQSQQLQSHHSHLNHHHFLCLFVGRINLDLFLFFFHFFFSSTIINVRIKKKNLFFSNKLNCKLYSNIWKYLDF